MTSVLGRRQAALLLTPACLLLFIFFVYPLLVVAWRSFYSGGFTLDAYKALFDTPLFARVLGNTLLVSCVATVLSTVVGYCLAAHIARQTNGRRLVCLTMVMLPLWTSVLVKSFSLTVLLGDQGLVNGLLVSIFGEGARTSMLFNRTGVIVGMINYLLPFTVFPILASLMAIDPVLARAARLMGAGPIRIFWRVTLPLSLPGVMAAALMGMTLSLGMFVTPALLGGRQDMMMANLVDLYTRQILDWEGASAIAMMLLVISGGFILLLLKVQGKSNRMEAAA
ncbi:ABC transporter permease [Bordetella ansorpii]|uniref:ABC transporter permease n=1 Tax=Bordetella ansorpii TaxID=288768 RepID=A0A157Q7W1_9BORD|nr:ABC transporter permease [Bordetella ansorpii]SAI41698.1 ABC transporter permease [Bordetella ansorpii]